MAKAVDLAAEDGREVARAATRRGLIAMPTLGEIYPVGGESARVIAEGRIFASLLILGLRRALAF